MEIEKGTDPVWVGGTPTGLVGQVVAADELEDGVVKLRLYYLEIEPLLELSRTEVRELIALLNKALTNMPAAGD